MNMQAEKIELAKRLHDTEDVNIVKAIKAIFTDSDYSSGEWGNLPDQVIDDVKGSIGQISAGMGIPYDAARETYKKRNSSREAVITKHNLLLYSFNQKEIILLAVFDTRLLH